jgi:ATP adenylyltransferase
MRQLWAPWRMAYVSGNEPEDPGCFICAAAADGLNSPYVVERAELTVSLLNRYPYSPGHVMIAPVRHVLDLDGMTVDEGGALIAAAQRTVRAATAALQAPGFNIGLNLGSVAGASIEHLHLHAVPRWGGDTNFMPVLADVKVLPEHLETTAAKLREAFAALESR